MLWSQHKNNPFLHHLRMTRDTIIVLKNFLSIRLKTLKTNVNLCVYCSWWCKIGDELFDVDCNVSTAILLVFIRQ